MNNEAECSVCKNRDLVRVGVNNVTVAKCTEWLENCDLADDCSCSSVDNISASCSSTVDTLSSYNSDGFAVVDRIKTKGDVNVREQDERSVCANCGCFAEGDKGIFARNIDSHDHGQIESIITNQAHNVYNNVMINKSQKVHLGNVTYINGPVYVNQTQNVVNHVTNVNDVDYKNKTLRIKSRIEWLAQPPLEEQEPLKAPAKFVIICHSATEEGRLQSENLLLIRLIQQFHVESRNYSDIGYNFLVGCDGNAYVGRGWGVKGAHTRPYNAVSQAICFVGCFINKLPPEVSLKQARALIEQGVANGSIAEDYSLVGHCQCIPSESPGRMLFEEIKSWKNFDSSISVETPSELVP